MLLSNATYNGNFIISTLNKFSIFSRFSKPLNAVLPIVKAFNRHTDYITCIFI